MAMDKEIIQQLIYFVVALIFFIVFSSSSKKKKTKTIPKNVNPTDVFEPVESIPKTTSETDQKNIPKQETIPSTEIFKPAEAFSTQKAKTNPRNIPIKEEKPLETISSLEDIYEDEVLADHRIFHKVRNDYKIENDPAPKFKITRNDFKKAVILSDIINPKYF